MSQALKMLLKILKVSLTDKMGFITTVDDARLKLEEIFKNNIEPNNP